MAGRNCSLLDLRHDPYPYSGTQKNVLNLSLDYNGLRGCFGSQATIERLERPAVPPFISHGRFIYKPVIRKVRDSAVLTRCHSHVFIGMLLVNSTKLNISCPWAAQ